MQGQFDEERKVWDKDAKEFRVEDVFSRFVKAGQLLEPKECVTHTFYPIYVGQKSVSFDIYSTKDSTQTYTTDPGMTKVGECVLHLPEPCKDPGQQSLRCTMVFGQAELKFSAVDVASGTEIETSLKFSHV